MRTLLTLQGGADATAQADDPASTTWLAGAEHLPLSQRGGVWVFDVPADAPTVTAVRVMALLDEAP